MLNASQNANYPWLIVHPPKQRPATPTATGKGRRKRDRDFASANVSVLGLNVPLYRWTLPIEEVCRVTYGIPPPILIEIVIGGTLRPHPATDLPKRLVKLTDDVIAVVICGTHSPELAYVRSAKAPCPVAIGGHETHPPLVLIPRRGVTRRHHQIRPCQHTAAQGCWILVVLIATHEKLTCRAPRPIVKYLQLAPVECEAAGQERSIAEQGPKRYPPIAWNNAWMVTQVQPLRAV